MLFIFPQWRLWNQIFQYMFAKYIADNDEKIVTTEAPYFSIIDEQQKKFKIIPTWKIFRYINFWLNKFFLILAKYRIITHITQKKIVYKWFSIEKKWFFIHKWLFKHIRYIDWFFINEDSHIIWKKIKIHQKYIKKAQDFLSQIPKDYYKVFIHIRRWDYLNWSVMWDTDLSLPLSYYKGVIDLFQKKYNSVEFIFLSDDVKYIESNFFDLKNKIISKNSIWTDLAIMTLCDWAVISPSSISYLWAYFMKNTLEIFAPNYWLWFKQKKWYPEWINTEKFNYWHID